MLLQADNIPGMSTKPDDVPVQVISSIHGINYENVRKIGDNNEYQKLYMIFQYNTFMSAVDKFDQYLSIYILNRRSIQWWKKGFFRMLELATTQW